MVIPNTIDKRTRQRILEASVVLLAKGGLSGSLLKDAAALAGCPLNRAEVFFRRDEDLVLALYARLAAELESRVEDLPEGDTATRFRAVMLQKLSLVAPYREALAALLAALLDPRHELGVLSPQTEIIRGRVMAVFSEVVLGATDGQKTEATARVRSLYAAHLALMFQGARPGANCLLVADHLCRPHDLRGIARKRRSIAHCPRVCRYVWDTADEHHSG